MDHTDSTSRILKPIQINKPAEGIYVVDFGSNLAKLQTTEPGL